MKLKPCPFCGGEADMITKTTIGACGEVIRSVVRCKECWSSSAEMLVSSSLTKKMTKKEAIAAWNRRAKK